MEESFRVACLNYEAKFKIKTTAYSRIFFRKGPKRGGWGGGGGVLRVPNPSSKPDFSPNLSYQICNPICSACLLTDAHHEVKALIGAIWIMNLHSPGLKKTNYPAGEHSSSSNPC